MMLYRFTRVIFALFIVDAGVTLGANSHFRKQCNKLTADSFFEPELVTDKIWRIYYTWNMQLEDKCMDMVFENATAKIVNRVFNDMYEYLEHQPYWEAATLLLSMGPSSHEMLLFADQGSAGQFRGVPNVVRDGNITPNKNSVPLFRIHMKLFNNGKYLVMSDCSIGVSTLSQRKGTPIYRGEIAGVAAPLGLGEGYAACLSDRGSDETYQEEMD